MKTYMSWNSLFTSLICGGTLLAQKTTAPAQVRDVLPHVMATTLPTTASARNGTAEQSLPASQTLDAASLQGKGAELLLKARATEVGLASEVLLKRPESNIQMAVRVKSGQGEWHRDDADILIGVEGTAQIITGGEIVDGKETAPGEIRGSGVRGGTTQAFHPGDYIRIEPRVAHQVILAPGSTLRYMAVKVHVTR